MTTTYSIPLNKGFTLLELLVAIAIFSVMSLVVYSSLSSMINTRQQLNEANRSLGEIQLAFQIIGRDIEQAVNRPIRNGVLKTLPAIQFSQPYSTLEMTVNGWNNPTFLRRSNLQRVAYRLVDGSLQKLTWPFLDRAPETEPITRHILDDVESMDVSFIGNGNRVFRTWPPPEESFAGGAPPLPQGIHVRMSTPGFGVIERIFLVGRVG